MPIIEREECEPIREEDVLGLKYFRADATDVRDGLPLLARLGRRGGTAGAFEKAQAQRSLGPLLFSSDGPCDVARQAVNSRRRFTLPLAHFRDQQRHNLIHCAPSNP